MEHFETRTRIQNIFIQIHLRFKLHYSYSHIVVALQLYIVKNGEFKNEKIIAFWKI